jgi:hypothetical protein
MTAHVEQHTATATREAAASGWTSARERDGCPAHPVAEGGE